MTPIIRSTVAAVITRDGVSRTRPSGQTEPCRFWRCQPRRVTCRPGAAALRPGRRRIFRQRRARRRVGQARSTGVARSGRRRLRTGWPRAIAPPASEIERHRPRGGKTVGTLPQRCACSGTAVDEVVRRRATPGWDGGHHTGVADRHVCNCDKLRLPARIWHSSSHAIASRTWCAAIASTPRWTEHCYPSLDQALDVINNAAEDSPMPPDEGMPPP